MKCSKSALLFLASSSLVLTLVLAVAMPDRMCQLEKISIARTSQTLAKINCEDKNNGCYEEEPRRFVNPHPGKTRFASNCEVLSLFREVLPGTAVD